MSSKPEHAFDLIHALRLPSGVTWADVEEQGEANCMWGREAELMGAPPPPPDDWIQPRRYARCPSPVKSAREVSATRYSQLPTQEAEEADWLLRQCAPSTSSPGKHSGPSSEPSEHREPAGPSRRPSARTD